MLNIDLIRTRQRELGHSNRALAHAIGVTPPRLLQVVNGRNEQTLTLRNINRLADTLGCHTSDLLTENPNVNADDTTSRHPLTATIAALLHSAKCALPVHVLADATATTLQDVETALEHLDQQLQTVGLRIRRDTNDNAISMVADITAITDQQRQRALRGAAARTQLDEATARLVHQILTGNITRKAVESSADGRIRLGQLINAGIVTEPEKATEPLRLTNDVIESLLLDEH